MLRNSTVIELKTVELAAATAKEAITATIEGLKDSSVCSLQQLPKDLPLGAVSRSVHCH